MRNLLFIIALFFFLSCKKNSNSTNNGNNNNSNNTPKTITSFSIDGHSVGDSISHNSFINGSNFGIIAYKVGGPELQITFSSSVTPADGIYSIVGGTATYAQCTFVYSDTGGYISQAYHGNVTITTSTVALNNAATFSNVTVSGNAGGHNISGTIAY